MLKSLDIGVRRTVALLATAVLAALVIVPVAVSKPVPGPEGPSIQDIRTQGHNWAAKARLLELDGGVRTQLLPSAQDVRTRARWVAQGQLPGVSGGVLGQTLPSTTDIRTQGNNWAAKARLLDVGGGLLQTTLPSAQDILTQGNNWAAKGRLLNANGGVFQDTQSGGSESAGFHWNEFGIGAGAMLGLVLLFGVVAAGFHVVHLGSLRQGRAA